MNISIKQYQQAADEKVSIGGIKWLDKWDVCIQCDSREEAETLRTRLAQPELEQLGEIVPADEEQLNRIAKLVQPEPVSIADKLEPVAWMYVEGAESARSLWRKRQTTDNKKEWVSLTDDEIADVFGDYMDSMDETEEEEHNWDYERLIEAKIKEKNGYLKEEK